MASEKKSVESGALPTLTGLKDLFDRWGSPPPKRRIYAVCGPPASGKSSLARQFCRAMAQRGGPKAAVLGMDGFHLDNRLLKRKGLLDRKGSIETFDAEGFVACVKRIYLAEDDVVVPVFDRTRDCAIAGARIIHHTVPIVILEGNYLLVDQPVWCDLRVMIHESVMLQTSISILRERLHARWQDHKLAPSSALKKINENDIPNARFVQEMSVNPDLILDSATYCL